MEERQEKVAIFECIVCHSFNELRIGDLPEWVPEDKRQMDFDNIDRAPLHCQGRECEGLPVAFRRFDYLPAGPTRDVKTVTDAELSRNQSRHGFMEGLEEA